MADSSAALFARRSSVWAFDPASSAFFNSFSESSRVLSADFNFSFAFFSFSEVFSLSSAALASVATFDFAAASALNRSIVSLFCPGVSRADFTSVSASLAALSAAAKASAASLSSAFKSSAAFSAAARASVASRKPLCFSSRVFSAAPQVSAAFLTRWSCAV